ncbi:MAG: hypothetical protein Q8N47_26190 [Bryobacterales bacterium]|nr:hypothetical protein [Bryobacterales bacterium]
MRIRVALLMRLWRVASLSALVLAAPALRAQELWQTDWDKFVDEFGGYLKRGASASEIRNTFGNKPVTWEGSFYRLDTGQSNTAFITMTNRTVTLSNGTSLPMNNPVGWTVKPEDLDRWRQFKVGDKVRYSITIVAGDDPFDISVVISGKVYLFNTTAALVTTPVAPAISAGGVVNGASFQSGISPGSWFSIQGTQLSSTTRVWNQSDFSGNNLPKSLDGVGVQVNGKDALVYFVSPSQINALAPSDTAVGPVNITVKNAAGSTSTTASLQTFAPAFFAFDPENRRYLAAVHTDGTLVGKAGLLGTAIATRPAAQGERLLLFGTGFGPTDPAVAPEQIVPAPARIPDASRFSLRIGGAPVTVEFAGLVSSGLYQFNIVVPSGIGGDLPVVADVGGVPSPANAFLTVAPDPGARMSVSPSTLTFSYQTGGTLPAPQSASLTVSPGSLGFSVSTSTSSGGNWLSATASSGSTPAVLTITANPAGLSQGTYTGNVAISVPGAANSPLTLPVTLAVTTAVPSITSLSPPVGAAGQTIAAFTVTGANLSAVTALEFAGQTGISVSNLQTTANTVKAQVAIPATALLGNLAVTAVSPAGRSNALTFSIQSAWPVISKLVMDPNTLSGSVDFVDADGDVQSANSDPNQPAGVLRLSISPTPTLAGCPQNLVVAGFDLSVDRPGQSSGTISISVFGPRLIPINGAAAPLSVTLYDAKGHRTDLPPSDLS